MSSYLINYLVNYAIKGLIVLCFFGFRSIRRRNIESSGAIGGQNIVQIKCPNKMSNLTILKVWKNGKPNWKYCKTLKNLNLKMWKSGEIAKIGGNNLEILQNLEKFSIWKCESLETLQKLGETIWKYCKTLKSLNLKMWKPGEIAKMSLQKLEKLKKGRKLIFMIYLFIYLFIFFF